MGDVAAVPGSLLHWAARENRADLVREALKIGEPIDALVPRNCKPPPGLVDGNNEANGKPAPQPPLDEISNGAGELETALHAAVRTSSVDTARALLAAGASVNVPDRDGATAIARAEATADVRESRILTTFVSELCQRAGRNDADGVKALVDAGLSPDRIDSEATANTALHWAASFGAAEATEALIQLGASVDMQNKQGATPLCDAVRNASESCVMMLVGAGADLEKARPLAQHEAIIKLLDQLASSKNEDREQDTKSIETTDVQEVELTESDGPNELDQDEPLKEPKIYPFSRDPEVAARSHDVRVAALGGAQELPTWAECLWPKPRRVCFDSNESFTFPTKIAIQVESDQISNASILADWLRAMPYFESAGVQVRQFWEPDDDATQIHLVVDNGATFHARSEAYRLVIGTKSIDLIGSDSAGLFYACCTLEQMIRLRHDAADPSSSPATKLTIPCGTVNDSPSLAKRGVMLDISSGRIPSLQTLQGLILQLARLKLNQFQLKMESNFKYVGHEVVWKKSGGLSAEEIMSLDKFCRDHYVELVPHQNSYTELSAWLTESPYQRLAENQAEVQEAIDAKSPFDRVQLSIAPGEESLRFLDGLYTQLLPCFSSKQVHVGFAEPEDTGVERTKESKTEITLSFLQRVSSLAAHHAKRTIQFWSGALGGPDIEFVPGDLPPRAVAMEVGRERNYPFNERGLILSRLGVPFYVCPSSGSQNSFGGRLSNAVETIKSAAKAAVRYNAVGLVLTDFGDNGHIQPLVVSYPPYLAAAGAAWNANEALGASDGDLTLISRLLDSHFFGDGDEGGLLGSVLCMYGDLHLLAEGKDGIWDHSPTDSVSRNGSRLFRLLVYGNSFPSKTGLQVSGLRKAQRRVEKSLDIVNGYEGKGAETDVLELQLVGELLRLACRIGILLCLSNESVSPEEPSVALSHLSGVTRSDIVNRMLQVLQLYRVCWDRRNFPDGFAFSVSHLEKALQDLSHRLPQMHEFIDSRQRSGWITPTP